MDDKWFTAGSGERFYLSEGQDWLIWERAVPTPADEAHRGLIYELRDLRKKVDIVIKIKQSMKGEK